MYFLLPPSPGFERFFMPLVDETYGIASISSSSMSYAPTRAAEAAAAPKLTRKARREDTAG